MISEIDAHVSLHRRIGEHPFVLFYTLVSPAMRQALQEYIDKNSDIIIAVDAMSQALDALTQASGQDPIAKPGKFIPLMNITSAELMRWNLLFRMTMVVIPKILRRLILY